VIPLTLISALLSENNHKSDIKSTKTYHPNMAIDKIKTAKIA
jgi:hypothetical protein